MCLMLSLSFIFQKTHIAACGCVRMLVCVRGRQRGGLGGMLRYVNKHHCWVWVCAHACVCAGFPAGWPGEDVVVSK